MKMNETNYRVERVLYEIQRRSPFMTDAEKQMGQQLRLLETKLHSLTQSLESLKRREQLYGANVKRQFQFFRLWRTNNNRFLHV